MNDLVIQSKLDVAKSDDLFAYLFNFMFSIQITLTDVDTLKNLAFWIDLEKIIEYKLSLLVNIEKSVLSPDLK